MEAFSDGVIAIIVTIMVLELKAPEHPTLAALTALWPIGFSYALSFLIVAIYWVNHRHVVRYARRVTPLLLWTNMLVLFTVSLIPFATAWLGGHLAAPVPNVAYGVVLVAGGISFLAFAEIVYRQNGDRADYAAAIRVSRVKGVIAVLLYVVGIALAAFLPGAVLLTAALAALMYFVPTTPAGPAGKGGRAN